ncbi:MAG: hypothetical protein CMJ78_20425 [Planctomycetaceae bacterium]|nr:hypothetical protein [Planctomycetaceae bacterium]
MRSIYVLGIGLLLIASQNVVAQVDAYKKLREINREAEVKILKSLQKRITIKFDNQPLSKVISRLATEAGISMVVSRIDLEDDGIDTESPITAQFTDIPIERALNRVISRFGMTWLIDNQVLVVTTEIANEKQLFARSYDVETLLAIARKEHKKSKASTSTPEAPGGGFFQIGDQAGMGTGAGLAGGNIPAPTPEEFLIQTVINHIERSVWIETEGTGGSMNLTDNVLVVWQTHQSQRLVASLIEQLTKACERGAEKAPVLVKEQFYPHNEDTAIIQKLTSVRSDFSYDKRPLAEVVADIRTRLKSEVILDQIALEEEGIQTDVPVTFNAKQVTLSSVLRHALKPLGMTYRIDSGALVLTTEVVEEERLETSIYPIQYYPQLSGSDLVDTILINTTRLWVDLTGTGGTITNFFGRALIVTNTQELHREVKHVIESVATKHKPAGKPATKKFVRRSFSLTDFAARNRPRNTQGAYRDPMMEARAAIQLTVETKSWQGNQPGKLLIVGDLIIVENTEDVLKKVDEFVRRHLKGMPN